VACVEMWSFALQWHASNGSRHAILAYAEPLVLCETCCIVMLARLACGSAAAQGNWHGGPTVLCTLPTVLYCHAWQVGSTRFGSCRRRLVWMRDCGPLRLEWMMIII